MLFYPVILPWPILLHALGLTGLGLLFVFESPRKPGQDRALLGLATIGLGLACPSLYSPSLPIVL